MRKNKFSCIDFFSRLLREHIINKSPILLKNLKIKNNGKI